MKILLTAFEPFGGESMNPSELVLERIPTAFKDCEIKKVTLPVAYALASEKLLESIETFAPDYCLCLGQAGGRETLSLEFIGINWREARIADNLGYLASGEKIHAEAEDGYFSTFPNKYVIQVILDKNIPIRMSYSAGSFICNEVLFTALHHFRQENSTAKAGFLHIPFLDQQVEDKSTSVPSISMELLERAMGEILEALVTYDESDVKTSLASADMKKTAENSKPSIFGGTH